MKWKERLGRFGQWTAILLFMFVSGGFAVEALRGDPERMGLFLVFAAICAMVSIAVLVNMLRDADYRELQIRAEESDRRIAASNERIAENLEERAERAK